MKYACRRVFLFFTLLMIVSLLSSLPLYSFQNNVKGGYLGISLPADFKAFSHSSPWNTPVLEDPEIDPFSGWMIDYLKNKAKVLKENIRKWTVPVHVIDSEKSPKVNVKSSNGYLYHTVEIGRAHV